MQTILAGVLREKDPTKFCPTTQSRSTEYARRVGIRADPERHRQLQTYVRVHLKKTVATRFITLLRSLFRCFALACDGTLLVGDCRKCRRGKSGSASLTGTARLRPAASLAKVAAWPWSSRCAGCARSNSFSTVVRRRPLLMNTSLFTVPGYLWGARVFLFRCSHQWSPLHKPNKGIKTCQPTSQMVL